MKLKNIFALAALALPMSMAAQSIHFEEQDYKQLGVYDTWEESPFRTGKLKGNYKVIDNHLTEVDEQLGFAINDSKKILAVQRSRFGSNTFGVRIDLNETFELTQQTRYIHLLIHRPYNGRVMVIGLGKRQDRTEQSPETEQFASISNLNVPGNRWSEVVVPMVGNGGIDIYSLVIVPDCESPHHYTEDQVCYIDNIEINDISTPEFSLTDYPINFEETEVITRDDRYFSGVTLSGSADGTQAVTVASSPKYAYHKVEDKILTVRPGETLTPDFEFKGTWMHGFIFLDTNTNGKFDAPLKADGSLADGHEVIAYSYFGKDGFATNSAGEYVTESNVLNPPAFKIPETLAEGFYTMRFKVDWNSVDAGGCVLAGNSILSNGGGIIDVRVNVHGEKCNVSDFNRNGEILSAEDGVKLDKYQAPFGQPFKIRMRPEKGFEYKGIIVKHGHKLNGDSILHSTPQWEKVFIERQSFNENHEVTLPAELMDGDVLIEGLFIEEGTYVEPVVPTRYATTTITEDVQFADTTTWYTIQIGQDGYVLADNGSNSYIALNNTMVDTEDDAQLWCFTGDEEKGYRLYNKKAGAAKVLASSTDMSKNTGGYTYPILYPVNEIPEGYVSVWRFEDSNSLGSTRVEHAYMYQDGFRDNKVNNRDNRLAFWNGGADAGSTLQIFFAKKDKPSGIETEFVRPNDGIYYDLSGCPVLHPSKGIYIQNGKKVYVD